MSVREDPLPALTVLAGQGAPTNEAGLNKRLGQIADILAVPEQRARRLLAAVIVAQMLPDNAAVKGGIGVKIRMGETGTRATRDLDLASGDQEATADALHTNLAKGWGQAPPHGGR